ncbi:MAG: DUF4127 family protein [Spirulinaceae cyanobacterium]
MMILYLPLDERPCNLDYPQQIAKLQPQIQLRVPPQFLLGRKKQAADISGLSAWLKEHGAGAQVAIASLEMLVYGGLLPSRLHHEPTETLLGRLHLLQELKASHPRLKILASTLIMRTPRYSSSEEEPDYYEQWGEQIFTWGWLTDKSQREGLTEVEQAQLSEINATLPSEYLADYRDRRAKNLQVNQAAIALVQSGVIDFLAIPQDDCARYGFTALDQQVIGQQIRRDRLQSRIHLYPGADEVGCTLLARAYGLLSGERRKVYVCYSAVGSEQIVPLYEDRPIGESVKAHLLAVGAQQVSDPQVADFTLAVNTAGRVMQEAWDQETQDITYSSYRNLNSFVAQLGDEMANGCKVAIADVAFANGGETELIHLLDDAQLLDRLIAYGGWNTNCNTIGSVIAMGILGVNAAPVLLQHNLIAHLLEDWLYQAIVRQDVIRNYLPQINASYYDFQGQTDAIAQEIARRLLIVLQTNIKSSFQDVAVDRLAVQFPWQRMFEVGITFDLIAL